MMTGFIGYENFFTSGTVTATSEATGFEKENGYDWLTTDWWKPTAGGTYYLTVDMGAADSADYVGIAGHNLGTESAQVTVQYSSDNFAADINDAYTLEAVSDDTTYIKRFTSQSARYWRLKVVSTNAALIGQVSIGARLDIPNLPEPGFRPPQFSSSNRILNSETDGGQFVGRSKISEGAEFTIPMLFLTPSWVRTNWPTLEDHINLYPFFYAWDYDDYPLESSYCWTQGDSHVPYTTTTLMASNLNVRGQK
jgi:hypothetical protein